MNCSSPFNKLYKNTLKGNNTDVSQIITKNLMLIATQLLHLYACQENKIIKKCSNTNIVFFCTDKFVELLLFNVQLFETHRTFLNLSIVDAKKLALIVSNFKSFYFSDTHRDVVFEMTPV